jgi:hypothetical protein
VVEMYFKHALIVSIPASGMEKERDKTKPNTQLTRKGESCL